jgi:hypothetical protein
MIKLNQAKGNRRVSLIADFSYFKTIYIKALQMKRSQLQKIIQEEIHEHMLDEDIIGWMAGVGKQVAYDIIDRRAKGLNNALKYDPKLLRLAKDLKMTSRDLEDRISSLASRDVGFLRALATQKFVRR